MGGTQILNAEPTFWGEIDVTTGRKKYVLIKRDGKLIG